jgi:hypothetical protein
MDGPWRADFGDRVRHDDMPASMGHGAPISAIGSGMITCRHGRAVAGGFRRSGPA